MTPDEIERIAAQENPEMPDGLELPEQLLLFTLRELYSNYRNGAVNRERAKREKSRILVAYRQLEGEHKIVKQQNEIRERLKKHIGTLYKCGCENCRKLLNIFTGVDRVDIPENVIELNECNKRLRDLVQERSERNAELATQIDMVRIALEKNDIERAKEIVKKCT
jgi:hypothetical protein